jgi:hypothetical protein
VEVILKGDFCCDNNLAASFNPVLGEFCLGRGCFYFRSFAAVQLTQMEDDEFDWGEADDIEEQVDYDYDDWESMAHQQLCVCSVKIYGAILAGSPIKVLSCVGIDFHTSTTDAEAADATVGSSAVEASNDVQPLTQPLAGKVARYRN